MTLPSYRWRAVHLAALWAYGVSQPVFSMLQGNPEFLVVRGSTRLDVVVFALLVAFVPPLVVVAVEAAVSAVSRMLAGALHVVAVWCFSFLVLLQVVRTLDAEHAAVLLLPFAAAAVAALMYPRSRMFRSFLSASIALPLIGLVVFVVSVPLATSNPEAADVRPATSTSLVLIVMDEFPVSALLRPDGSIDRLRYPGFARLAADSTWYSRATTVHEFTTQAVPAILTGQIPHKDELPTLDDHPENLFTLLGRAYGLRAIEPVTRLCPERYCPDAHPAAPFVDRARGLLYDAAVGYLYRILPESMHLELPPIGDRWGAFGDAGDAATRERLVGALDMEDVNLAIEHTDHRPRTEFARFLRSMGPHDPKRTFYFLHLLLPHSPYRMLPSGREYGNAETIDGIEDDAFDKWSDAPLLVQQSLQRELLQVAYTDRLLGTLLHRLKAIGLYDRALVVVTADHGSSFVPGGNRRTVSSGNIPDIASVPLFVKYPHQQGGRRDTRQAKTIDVLPTIAEVLGVRLPWRVDGRSLRGKPVSGRRVVVWRRAGGFVAADADRVRAGVLGTARRNAALFGTGAEPIRAPGPYRTLVGRRVAEPSSAGGSSGHVRLDGEALFANVRTESAFVPARITGEIDGLSLGAGSALAVTVNGRVEATTRTFRLDGRTRFAAVVGEGSFLEGANSVSVFSVAKRRSGLRLAYLGGTASASPYRLAADGTGIVLPGRRLARLSKGELDGALEAPIVEGGTVRIRGWAADLRHRSLVDRVLIFSGTELVYSAATTVFRWDLGSVPSTAGSARVGFVAELPAGAIRGGQVRVFAVRGRTASELEVPRSTERLVASTERG